MDHVIALAGDIYLDREGPSNPLRGAGLEQADFFFANLEGPLTRADDSARVQRGWWSDGFRMKPEVGADLQQFSALSIANNHALDYGAAAYVETLEALERLGVPFAGGGRNEADARAPAYVESNGLRVAFLAYTCLYQNGWSATGDRPGMATIQIHTSYQPPPRVFEQPGSPPIVRTFADATASAQLRGEVQAARTEADIVLVSIHWGVSKSGSVLEYQRELAGLCIAAGADVVFGAHGHILQELEIIDDKPVLYSLGNFVVDKDFLWLDDATAVVNVHVRAKRVVGLGVVPLVRAADGDPVPPSPERAREIVESVIPAGAWERERRRTANGAEAAISLVSAS